MPGLPVAKQQHKRMVRAKTNPKNVRRMGHAFAIRMEKCMKNSKSKIGAVAAAAATLVVTACGSGGGGTSAEPTTMQLSVSVMDGAIEGAAVCQDKNNNGLCDAGEPSASSDASGKAVLTIATADTGKYAMLAIVDTNAKDADESAKVATRYTMQAPKDAPGLVTPLTTLVQTAIERTGASTKDAAAVLQQQLNLSNSPLADYAKSSDNQAHTLANALVVIAQQQAAAIQAALNTKTASGSTITQADLDRLVNQKVSALLSQLVAAANDSSVTGAATPQARIAALKLLTKPILLAAGIQDATVAANAIDMDQ
jgi:ribosome-binding protein aMBF1 (putative translation factor)